MLVRVFDVISHHIDPDTGEDAYHVLVGHGNEPRAYGDRTLTRRELAQLEKLHNNVRCRIPLIGFGL